MTTRGNYDYHALNQAEVAGIDSMYTAIFMEKLVITPTIQSEDKERGIRLYMDVL